VSFNLTRERIAQIRAAYMTAWIKNTNPADVAAGPTGYMTPPFIDDLGGRYTVVDLNQVQAALEALSALGS